MIANKYSWPCGIKVIIRIFNLEGYASCIVHDILKATSCSPLRYPPIANEPENNGGNDAICSANNEREIGRQKTGEEACEGYANREHVEDDGKAEEECGEQQEIIEDGRHVRMAATRGGFMRFIPV